MTFNEFQRELQKRGIDPHNAFMLTLVYEQVSAISQRIDDCASVLLQMAETVKGLTDLNEFTLKSMQKLERGGRPFGVDVHSVARDPKDD